MSKVYLQDIELAKKADVPDISGKQDVLVSGTNIKTINNQSILGSGNIDAGSSIFLEYGVSSELDVAEAYNAFNANTEIYVIYSDSTEDFIYRIARFEDVTTSYTLTTEVCDIIFSVLVTGDIDSDNPAEWDIMKDNVIYRSDIEDSISSASENPVESRAIKTYVDSELSDYYTKVETDSLLGEKVGNTDRASDTNLGLVKLNSNQSIGMDADGHLTIGGLPGQFPTTTGIYAAADRDPRAVGDSSFLITDAIGMSLDTSRAFALVSGYGVACKSAAAGTTQYRVKNTYANRFKCKMCEGGFASINEATSKVERIVPVVSVTINGNPYTPDSSADSSATADDIIITTEETLNPDSAITNIRLFGMMKSYSTVHVGNGVTSLGGGRNLLIGGGITKAGSSNDDCAVGMDIYVSGNGNAAFGRWHIMAKNRGFAAGTGHDFTNAIGEGVAAVGQYSDLSPTTLLAVGNGTSHTARSNAFEVTSDGGIVLKSPNGTQYKISVDDNGNISTTAV